MRILITAFDPFGGEKLNPAYEAVRRLPNEVAGIEIIKLEIPTMFSQCGPAVETGIQTYQPDVILCVGLAGGRTCVTVERIAVNLMDARIPDNAGAQPIDEPVQPDGPAAYFATIPVKAIVKHVQENGIPCHLSYSAGTYVCNCVMYQALHMSATRYPHIRAGFIHVPFSDGQAACKPNGTPSESISVITKALELAVEAISAHPQDVHESMGTTC